MDLDHLVRRWTEHVRVLTEEIGERGSTTDGEREGHQYCEQVFTHLGLTPQMENFQSAHSVFQFYLISGLFMVSAYITYRIIAQPIGSALAMLLAGLSFYSIVRENLYKSNPIRSIAGTGQSQNVYSILDPIEDHHNDLILVGHVDTPRTPVFFSRPFFFDIWRVYSFTTLGIFAAQVILYTLSIFWDWAWIGSFAALSFVDALILITITAHADQTPFTVGANDNATGAGIVLALAEKFVDSPLKNTRIWFVNTGCEEVKHYGADDFFRRHHQEFKNPATLVFEMMGCDGPGWLVHEGALFPFLTWADEKLLGLCESIAQRNPDLNASATRVVGGGSEMADAVRYGVPAITLIGISAPTVGFGYRGPELYWHKRSDTLDKLNPDVMSRNMSFVTTLIHALDQPE